MDSDSLFTETSLPLCPYSANEICQESRRSTVNAEDVIKALEEMEFDDLIEPLKEALGGKLPVFIFKFWTHIKQMLCPFCSLCRRTVQQKFLRNCEDVS